MRNVHQSWVTMSSYRSEKYKGSKKLQLWTILSLLLHYQHCWLFFSSMISSANKCYKNWYRRIWPLCRTDARLLVFTDPRMQFKRNWWGSGPRLISTRSVRSFSVSEILLWRVCDLVDFSATVALHREWYMGIEYGAEVIFTSAFFTHSHCWDLCSKVGSAAFTWKTQYHRNNFKSNLTRQRISQEFTLALGQIHRF